MDAGSERRFSSAGWLASIAIHGGLAWMLVARPIEPHPARTLSPVRFSVVQAPAPAPAPPKAAESEPVPSPPQPVRAKSKPRLARPELKPASASPSAPVESEPPVAELAGKTLTAEGNGASWSSVVGNGDELRGPMGPAVAVPPMPRTTAEPVKPAPSPEVRVKDLAHKPAPPSLDGLLRKNYPADARRRGIEGAAVVRARIDPDGRVRTATVVSETGPSFGDACRRTVQGSQWTRPTDRDGRAVATSVSYKCAFRVEQ